MGLTSDSSSPGRNNASFDGEGTEVVAGSDVEGASAGGVEGAVDAALAAATRADLLGGMLARGSLGGIFYPLSALPIRWELAERALNRRWGLDKVMRWNGQKSKLTFEFQNF